MKRVRDRYGRGSAQANGTGFVDLEPGDTFAGLEAKLRTRINETYVNGALGISASIGSYRNANELAKHLSPGENEEVHKFAAKNIGVIFERGAMGIRHLDKKAHPGQRWMVTYVRVFAVFIFADEKWLATITLKETEQRRNFYSVEAVDIMKDAGSERTPRGAMSEDLNAAPLQNLASFTRDKIAYYVGDVNRTQPSFVARPEAFGVERAAMLLVEMIGG